MRTLFLLLVVALLLVAAYRLMASATRPGLERRDELSPLAAGTRWVVTHYDAREVTMVVLQRLSRTGAHVLDEHVVRRIPTTDPRYEDLFLEAMATARQRQAVFESEQEEGAGRRSASQGPHRVKGTFGRQLDLCP